MGEGGGGGWGQGAGVSLGWAARRGGKPRAMTHSVMMARLPARKPPTISTTMKMKQKAIARISFERAADDCCARLDETPPSTRISEKSPLLFMVARAARQAGTRK